MQSFLGLMNYCRQYICDNVEMARPLRDMCLNGLRDLLTCNKTKFKKKKKNPQPSLAKCLSFKLTRLLENLIYSQQRSKDFIPLGQQDPSFIIFFWLGCLWQSIEPYGKKF